MKKFIIGAGALMVPAFAFAQGPQWSYIESIFIFALRVLNSYVIPGLVIVATGFFMWSVVQYIRADAADKDNNRKKMINGVIGLTVMVAIWGIASFLISLFGVGNPVAGGPNVPCPPGYHWNGSRCI